MYPASCALIALNGNGSEKWRFNPPSHLVTTAGGQLALPSGPSFAGVAIANGVVYLQPELDPHLYAVSTATGALMGMVTTNGSNSGPAVAHGRIYLGGGNYWRRLGFPSVPGVADSGSLMAIGLPR